MQPVRTQRFHYPGYAGATQPQALLDAFHAQLEHAGCIAYPVAFHVTPPGSEDIDGAEASHTGPNQVNEADRCVSGVANVLSVSRSGIRLHISGLDVKHYNECNPVVLACHCSVSADLMPGAIGTVEKVVKTEKQTELRFRNMRFDEDPIAEAWYQKVLSGTVRMVSVGFLPIEWSLKSETVGTGKNKKEIAFIDIPESELLEISVVPIGANRGARIGQATRADLLERVQAAEQKTAALLDALTRFVRDIYAAKSEQARTQLLAMLDRFSH